MKVSIELLNAQHSGANAENLVNLQTGFMNPAPPMLSCWEPKTNGYNLDKCNCCSGSVPPAKLYKVIQHRWCIITSTEIY